MSQGDAPSAPWTGEDVIRWCSTVGGGAVALVGGWWLASGQPLMAGQQAGAAIAVCGLVVSCWGHLMLIMRGRGNVGHRRSQLLPDPVSPTQEQRSEVSLPLTATYLSGGQHRYFHLAGCAFTADRDFGAGDHVAQLAAGRTPCGVCLPGGPDLLTDALARA